MPGVFLTRKQKQLMRERKRKKKLFEKGTQTSQVSKPTETDINSGKQTFSKKRQRPSEELLDHIDSNSIGTSHVVDSTNVNTKQDDNGILKILVPSNLSSKDAKKFRKDARRKAKLDGTDPNAIIFIEQDETLTDTSNQAKDDSSPPKKKTKIFPCINELVAANKKLDDARLRKKETDKLSEEFKSKFVAIDCEMVGIGPDAKKSALARVSIVDWDGNTILDKFVKVPGKVTDFRTWVSGVKPKNLKSSDAVELKACREDVAAILKNKIVVGHALKNDFDALLMSHPKDDIRDTALYKPFQRQNGQKWQARKLRDLVKEHCDMTIQIEGESHNSVDDAKAAMELYKVVYKDWEKELLLQSSKKMQRK